MTNEHFESWVIDEVVPTTIENIIGLSKRIQICYNLINNLPLGNCDCSTYELAEFGHICLVGIAEIMQEIGEGIHWK
jgi:hypothetical protein